MGATMLTPPNVWRRRRELDLIIYPLGSSASEKFGPPPEVDRLLSVVESGPVTDSQPSEARIRAVQASKVTKLSLKFLRDILSTSFESPSGKLY